VIDDRQAREYALARSALDPEAKLRADQSAFRLLGLVSSRSRLLKTLLRRSGGAGGAGTTIRPVVLLLRRTCRKEDGRASSRAHEMTHALERPARYDIGTVDSQVLDDDARVVRSFPLVEGARPSRRVYVTKGVAAGKLDSDRSQCGAGRARRSG